MAVVKPERNREYQRYSILVAWMESPQILIDTSIYLKSKNQLISPPDIFIAATAISHNLSLVTLNKLQKTACLKTAKFSDTRGMNLWELRYWMLLKGKNYYKILMPGINEATYTDLNAIEKLRQICWKHGLPSYISVGIPWTQNGKYHGCNASWINVKCCINRTIAGYFQILEL